MEQPLGTISVPHDATPTNTRKFQCVSFLREFLYALHKKQNARREPPGMKAAIKI
jgi:hypothetical protein